MKVTQPPAIRTLVERIVLRLALKILHNPECPEAWEQGTTVWGHAGISVSSAAIGSLLGWLGSKIHARPRH